MLAAAEERPSVRGIQAIGGVSLAWFSMCIGKSGGCYQHHYCCSIDSILCFSLRLQ